MVLAEVTPGPLPLLNMEENHHHHAMGGGHL